MKEFYSHPKMPLMEHLDSVARNGVELYKAHMPSFPFLNRKNPEILEDIIYITLFSHDLGKGTSFFQEYLLSKGKTGKPKLKNHAQISALFGKYWIKQLIANYGGLPEEASELIPIASYQSILNHHGKMGVTRDEIEEPQGKRENLQIQFSDLRPFMEIAFQSLKKKYNYLTMPESFELLAKVVFDDDSMDWFLEEWLNGKHSDNVSCQYYIFQVYLYSLLLDSDKTHTIYRENYSSIENSPLCLSADVVREYISNIPQTNSPLNQLRDQIFNTVCSEAGQFPLEQRILTLQVPTGCGKTLTGLCAALIIANRIYLKRGSFPRIVYCLPFTSIIDQNYEVYRQVFKSFNKNDDFQMIKHHHLCDYSQKDNGTTPDNEDESQEFSSSFAKDRQFAAEGWNGQIVVSTLYQLFHSMFEKRNSPFRKFHRFSECIFLIDEVQAISHKYFSLIREFLKTLSEIFNSYFIFISATQPFIFPVEEIRSLCPNEEALYKKELKSRVSLRIHSVNEAESIEDLTLWASDNKASSSRMFIMNTIKSASKLYDLLEKENNGNCKPYFLSTRIIPKERLKRIDEIREDLRNNKKILLVTTQIVEAGVDIDFREVIRDFAPWDSIMQASGRCNRHGIHENGDVHIFSLKNDNKQKRYADFIYDSVLLGITEDLFKQREIIPESQFFSISQDYYRAVQQKTSTMKGDKVLEAISAFDFEGVKTHFRLIEEKFRSQDLFIPVDEEAKELWLRYEKLLENQDMQRFDKKAEFNRFKGDLLKYVISVPEKEVQWYSGKEQPIIFLTDRFIGNYNPVTGYSEGDKALDCFF